MFSLLAMTVSGAVLLVQVALYSAVSGWSYQKENAWPSICKGKLQSPIDITLDHTFHGNPQPFLFTYSCYEKQAATLTNSGHSVEIKFIDDSDPLVLWGGGLRGQYLLAAFHFHWSSEHTINGQRFPLEGHFVFYSSEYEDLQSALKHEHGVAVLGVLYDLTFEDNPAFSILLEKIPTIAHKTKEPTILEHPIAVCDFFPPNINYYFRYNGSLTTPGCNEGVIWTLFSVPSYISPAQLQPLTHVWDENNKLVDHNFRSAQELNGRGVLLVY